jgi:hypothetical protein
MSEVGSKSLQSYVTNFTTPDISEEAYQLGTQAVNIKFFLFFLNRGTKPQYYQKISLLHILGFHISVYSYSSISYCSFTVFYILE